MKKCSKCNQAKDDTEFYRCRTSLDGLEGACKKCRNKNSQANYRANREYYVKFFREREQRPERRAYRRAYDRAYQRSDRLQVKARISLTNALRAGTVTRQPCEVCGNIESQGHHDDYSKPLDVRWLCFQHHREHHGQIVSQMT